MITLKSEYLIDIVGKWSMQRFASVQKQVQKMMPVSTVMAIALSSCVSRPLPECYPLITVLNQANDLLTNVDLNDEQALEQKAIGLQTINKELETLQVTNKQLDEFRNEFVKIYQTYSQAFEQTGEAIALVNAEESTDITVAQVKQAKLQVDRSRLSIHQASQKAESLSRQINKYCRVSTR
jgi:hypothetical protein